MPASNSYGSLQKALLQAPPMFLGSGRGVLQRDGVFGRNYSTRNTPWEPAQRTRSGIADKLFDTHAPLYCVIIHTGDIPLLLLSTSLAFVSSQKQFNRAEGHPVFKAHRVSASNSWSWCEAAQSFGGKIPLKSRMSYRSPRCLALQAGSGCRRRGICHVVG